MLGQRPSILYALVACAVKFATIRMRKLIAKAKDTFLRGLTANGPQTVSAVLQRAKQAGLGSKDKKPVRRALPS